MTRRPTSSQANDQPASLPRFLDAAKPSGSRHMKQPPLPSAEQVLEWIAAQREACIYVQILGGQWEPVRLSKADTADLQRARRQAWNCYYISPRGKKYKSERYWCRSLAKAIEYELGRRGAGMTVPRQQTRPVSFKDPRPAPPAAG